MFNLGPFELVAIFVVALLVFGPDKLPEMGKQVGKAVREFRKFQASMQENVRDVMEPITGPITGPIISDTPIVGPTATNIRGEIPTGNNVPRSATVQEPGPPEGEAAPPPGTFGHYDPESPAPSTGAAPPQNGPAPTAGEAAPPAGPADPDSR